MDGLDGSVKIAGERDKIESMDDIEVDEGLNKI